MLYEVITPDLALRSVNLMAVPNLPSITVLAQTLINDLDLIHEPFILVLDRNNFV